MSVQVKLAGKRIAHVLDSIDYRRLKNSITFDNILDLVEDYEFLPVYLFDEKYYEKTSIPTMEELKSNTEVFSKIKEEDNKVFYVDKDTHDFIIETHKCNRLRNSYQYDFQRNGQDETDYVGSSKTSIFNN